MLSIKMVRERFGFTRSEMAQLAGVDYSTLARWERGVGSPPVSKLLALARELGIHPGEFFARDEVETRQ